VSVESEVTLPPWAIKALIWIVIAITSLFTGTYGWLFRDVMRRVKMLESNEKNHASVLSVAALEVRSRTELLAYLKQMREDQDQLNAQVRDDRQRLHQENRDDNAALRSDVRAVHARVDELFK
jgi:hypothetical protein